MAITYRTPGPWGPGSGSNLSPAQNDNNFWTLVQDIADVNAALSGGAVVSIASFAVVGSGLYVTLTNGAILGPYQLPVAEWHARGHWEPLTLYDQQDVFDINGSLYLVLVSHTSASVFDPHATDGTGHNLYGLLLTATSNVLPIGGATGMVLTKHSGADYDVKWATEELATLGDVRLGSPLDAGQYLQYASGFWTNVDLAVSFSQISDIALGSPHTAGDLLSYNGTHWTNIPQSDLVLDVAQTRFASSALPGTTGTVSLDPTLAELFTVTPTGDITLNAASAPNGARIVLEVLTSGTTSYDIAFNTNFIARGDLITGKVNNAVFLIAFVSDGSAFIEESRTGYLKAVALGTTGTISLDPTLGEVFTVTPTGAITLNAASAPVGKRISLIVTTSGTSSFNITPTTNFKSVGALASGTVSGKVFTISFIGDGTNLNETSRTTAM